MGANNKALKLSSLLQEMQNMFKLAGFIAIISVVSAVPPPQTEIRKRLQNLGYSGAERVAEHQLKDEELIKELDELLESIDGTETDDLRTVIDNEDLPQLEEFEQILEKLKEIGYDDDDIEYLYRVALLMFEFLNEVEDIVKRLYLEDDGDLMDNILLYLLGMKNPMGPLGFVALHHILPELRASEDGEIVDVKVEPLTAAEKEELGLPDS